jgi:hypothetical protein
LNPSEFIADHVIVAWLMTNSPLEPGGLLTGELLVTGPLHWMSKLALAGTDSGSWRWKRALGMLEKSIKARLVMVIRAAPAPM